MTLAEMERHPVFRLAFWRRNLYLALFLVLELALLAFLACLHFQTHEDREHLQGLTVHHFLGFYVYFDPLRWSSLTRLAVSLLVLVGFSHYAFIKAFRGKGMISLYPEDRSKGRQFGSLRGPELVEMVQELARTLGVRRIDRIAVSKQPDPNAYTARILGLGNVVVLHSNLLSILTKEEVRSVIAHEVGHIRRKDSVLYQLLNMPRTGAWVIVLLNFVRVIGGVMDSDSFGEAFARFVFLGMASWLVVKAFGLLERLSNLASQQTELMVDAYAAHVCGWDKQLNALLLVGERAEALTGYIEAVQKVAGRAGDELNEKSLLRLLNRLPGEELDAQRAIENAASLYIADRLTMLREKLCVPLTDEQISDLAVKGAEALRQRKLEDEPADEEDEDEEPDADTQAAREEARKEAEKAEEERRQQEEEQRKRLLFWRDYDKDRSGYLTEPELAGLVEDLRKQPDRMIFREFLEPDGEWKDHPTTRHRILFLADLFAPKAS
jgi:Zn-dependent protease with chaperone function